MTAARIANIAASVIGAEHVGETDDFYALGMDSLAVIQMLSRVREVLGVELDLLDALEARTAAELARVAAASPPAAPVARVVPRAGGPLVLTPFQEWMLHDIAAVGYLPAHVHRASRIRGHVDVEALRRSCAEIVRRHGSLRARFPWHDGVPTVAIDEDPPVAFEAVTAGRKTIDALATRFVNRPFDITAGPLYRFGLVTYGPAEHLLLVSLHELVGDGWSVNVIARELRALYRATLAGEPSPLPELAIQYTDYAAMQRAALTPEARAGMREFWRAEMRGAPLTLAFPYEGGGLPAPPPRHSTTATLSLDLDASERVRALCAERAVTPFVAFLAVYGALLHAYAGADDVVVYTPVANRNRVETEPLVGLFVTGNLPLRLDLTGDPSLYDLVDRLRDLVGRTFAHSETPVEEILAALADGLPPGMTRQHHPRFRYRVPVEPLDLPGTEAEAYDPWYAQEHFAFWVDDAGPGTPFRLTLAYDTASFDSALVQRMLGYAARLVDRLLTEPKTALSELDVLAAVDREPLRGPAAVPDVVAWLAARSGAEPSAVAFVPVDTVDAALAGPPAGVELLVVRGRWPSGGELPVPERPDVVALFEIEGHGVAGYATPRDGILRPVYEPAPGTELAVVGTHGRPVPRGAVGRVAVRSGGTETTTPELGRVRDDGTVALLGRADDEVTFRGYRLTEVATFLEMLLAAHPSVARAAVTVTPAEGLVAYVVPAAGAGPDPGELDRWLAERSGGLRPPAYRPVAALPVRADGTVDRAALAAGQAGSR